MALLGCMLPFDVICHCWFAEYLFFSFQFIRLGLPRMPDEKLYFCCYLHDVWKCERTAHGKTRFQIQLFVTLFCSDWGKSQSFGIEEANKQKKNERSEKVNGETLIESPFVDDAFYFGFYYYFCSLVTRCLAILFSRCVVLLCRSTIIPFNFWRAEKTAKLHYDIIEMCVWLLIPNWIAVASHWQIRHALAAGALLFTRGHSAISHMYIILRARIDLIRNVC